jgi:hypothetical protein
MALTTDRKRAPVASRRVGYAVAILVNAAMLFAVNRWPGWDAVPFLTTDTREVLALVNASILAGVIANTVYLANDARWVRALGDLVTTSIGLAAMVRIWQVFPLDFAGSSFNWELVARILLAVGIVGSGIAIITALVSLITSPSKERQP